MNKKQFPKVYKSSSSCNRSKRTFEQKGFTDLVVTKVDNETYVLDIKTIEHKIVNNFHTESLEVQN